MAHVWCYLLSQHLLKIFIFVDSVQLLHKKGTLHKTKQCYVGSALDAIQLQASVLENWLAHSGLALCQFQAWRLSIGISVSDKALAEPFGWLWGQFTRRNSTNIWEFLARVRIFRFETAPNICRVPYQNWRDLITFIIFLKKFKNHAFEQESMSNDSTPAMAIV